MAENITIEIASAPIDIQIVAAQGPSGKDGSINLAGEILASDEKETPADDDWIGVLDSAAGFVMKKVKKSKLSGGVSEHASLTVGAGNAAVTYEAVAEGAAGEAISIAYAESADALTLLVSLAGSDFTITPAPKAKISISGVTDPSVTIADLTYGGTESGRPFWDTFQGAVYKYGVARWRVSKTENKNWTITYKDADGTTLYESTVVSTELWPDDVTFPSPSPGTGIPVVTFVPCTAHDVAEAVNSQQDLADQTGTPKIVIATIPTGYVGSSAVVTPFVHTHLSL